MSVMTKRKPMPSMESMRADRDADELVRHISELEGWGVKLEKGKTDYHGLRSIADFHTKRLKQVDYLYAGLGAILFSGPNDVGKSSVVEQLAARVLLGTTEGVWAGQPYGVLFIMSEEDPGMVKQAMQAHGVSLNVMRQRLFTYVTNDNENVSSSDYDTVDLPADVPMLQRLCEQNDIRMVVFDALADCMPGVNLYALDEVNKVFKPLNKWGAEDDILIVGVHHNNKSLDGSAKQAVGGSAAFTNKPRIVVSLDQAKDGTRVMQLVKVKGRSDKPSYTYEFETRFVDTVRATSTPALCCSSHRFWLPATTYCKRHSITSAAARPSTRVSLWQSRPSARLPWCSSPIPTRTWPKAPPSCCSTRSASCSRHTPWARAASRSAP